MRFATTVLALSSIASTSAVEFLADSTAGAAILANARRLDNGADYSFLANYAVKFQGCHHVQQWNSNAEDDSDVKIKTKRLARFRLCPVDQCSNEKSAGCTSKFGDYIVDMDTFVEAYLSVIQDQIDDICGDVQTSCNNECSGDSDCEETCYATYDASFCLEQQKASNYGFDVSEYAGCKEVEFENQNGYQYYVGAFCAEQGGQVQLGLFTDDTCTTFAQNGYSTFKSGMGFALPYSDDSLISYRCLSCGNSGYGVCDTVYPVSGKCETRMSIEYPNESSCGYIEGIKIIREDGVIRTSRTRKSKAAAVAIGVFTTLSVLLAAYVYYLRTKLSRAQINLHAASQPLT